MIIALDANILVALFTDKTVAFGLKNFSRSHNVQQTIIPTPALTEFLAHDHADRFAYVQKNKKRIVSIQSFDEKAAILTAQLAEKYNLNKLDINKQKVKVDLQILGTAIASQAQCILTKDNDFKDYVERLNLKIKVINIRDLCIEANLFE